MKFVFHYRSPFTKQLALLEALHAGMRDTGDTVTGIEGFDGVRNYADGLIMLGIGGHSRSMFDAYRAAGKHVVFWDKGYSRGGWYRVAVNDFQPLAYLEAVKRPHDRALALGLDLKTYRQQNGSHILFDGASNKFCIWQSLGDWIEWGAATVRKIRTHSLLPVIYRPRPSHNGSVPVPGAELSERPLAEDLARARVVVSYGGNIGFDAAIAGIPHFAIGDSIARPLSETCWKNVGKPHVPSPDRRREWLAAVAHCQFRMEEIASGQAWRHVRETIDALRPV